MRLIPFTSYKYSDYDDYIDFKIDKKEMNCELFVGSVGLCMYARMTDIFLIPSANVGDIYADAMCVATTDVVWQWALPLRMHLFIFIENFTLLCETMMVCACVRQCSCLYICRCICVCMIRSLRIGAIVILFWMSEVCDGAFTALECVSYVFVQSKVHRGWIELFNLQGRKHQPF